MRMFVAILVLVVAGCSGGGDPDPTTEATSGTVDDLLESDVSVLVKVDVDSLGTEHIDPPASYDQRPPIGGDHYPFWQNCGYYDVELIEGAATHTMEHGAVWITYNSSTVSEAEISSLVGMAQDNGKLLISPYPHDEKLVLSAWGVQLRTDFSPGDPDVQAFIDEWIDNPELDEAGARCTGAAGIPPSDTRSLSDGTQVPPEFG